MKRVVERDEGQGSEKSLRLGSGELAAVNEKKLNEKTTATPRGALLTVRDVAAWLRVHEKTVYEWAEKRRLPCFRVGNRLRFDANDITRWLASRKEEH